jgi:hypothetical protein
MVKRHALLCCDQQAFALVLIGQYALYQLLFHQAINQRTSVAFSTPNSCASSLCDSGVSLRDSGDRNPTGLTHAQPSQATVNRQAPVMGREIEQVRESEVAVIHIVF